MEAELHWGQFSGKDENKFFKSLLLTNGREVWWECGPFWSFPHHAQVMDALGIKEADVVEFRRFQGDVLTEARFVMNPTSDLHFRIKEQF